MQALFIWRVNTLGLHITVINITYILRKAVLGLGQSLSDDMTWTTVVDSPLPVTVPMHNEMFWFLFCFFAIKLYWINSKLITDNHTYWQYMDTHICIQSIDIMNTYCIHTYTRSYTIFTHTLRTTWNYPTFLYFDDIYIYIHIYLYILRGKKRKKKRK